MPLAQELRGIPPSVIELPGPGESDRMRSRHQPSPESHVGCARVARPARTANRKINTPIALEHATNDCDHDDVPPARSLSPRMVPEKSDPTTRRPPMGVGTHQAGVQFWLVLDEDTSRYDESHVVVDHWQMGTGGWSHDATVENRFSVRVEVCSRSFRSWDRAVLVLSGRNKGMVRVARLPLTLERRRPPLPEVAGVVLFMFNTPEADASCRRSRSSRRTTPGTRISRTARVHPEFARPGRVGRPAEEPGIQPGHGGSSSYHPIRSGCRSRSSTDIPTNRDPGPFPSR